MPIYKPLGTKIQLVACSLADTTTSNPQRQKQLATQDTRHAENALLSATALSETHIPCMDEATRLHFLGNVPFYIVQAGADLFKPKEPSLADRTRALILQQEAERREVHESVTEHDSQVSQESSAAFEEPVTSTKDARRSQSSTGGERRRSGIVDEASMPQALGLIITLSKNTFLDSWERGRPRGKGKGARQHVKYDVYFNGELAKSDCQHSRYFSGKENDSYPTFDNGNIRIVSGKQVGILVARPWVIIPPEQTAGGSLREVKRSKSAMAGAAERWQAIGEALHQRADELGYNAKEERSPLGQYLANLATMKMPDAVAEMQKPGGHKLGIIDVVITAGEGIKGQISHHYLTQPESLVDPKFKHIPVEWEPKSVQQLRVAQQELVGRFPAALTQQDSTDNVVPRGSGEGSVAVAARKKRNVAAPSSYRDAAPRRSRASTPEPGGIVPPERSKILCPFPPIPEIKFSDTISMTPTKAEEVRVNRHIQTSRPTIDVLKRVHQVSEPSWSMPPPPTPISRSARTNKRRHSDTISIGQVYAAQSGSTFSRPGATSGSKSVSGFLGMTKRGVFNREDYRRGSLTVSPTKEKAAESPARLRRTMDSLTITRIVITGSETPIIDRTLALPYHLGLKHKLFRAGQLTSSQFQPLDESVVFDLKNIKASKAAAWSPFSFGPPTNTQSTLEPLTPPHTSPIKHTTAPAPSASATSSTPAPTPLPRQATPISTSKVKYEDLLEETRATWRTPELSKDCVISFAEEGDWISAAGKGSVLRHVRSARAGVFIESEVVFAVRYIVAGGAGLTM